MGLLEGGRGFVALVNRFGCEVAEVAVVVDGVRLR
jgi:hypothetical protein